VELKNLHLSPYIFAVVIQVEMKLLMHITGIKEIF